MSNMPKGRLAARQVGHAAGIAQTTMHDKYWIIAEHCSSNFVPDLRPQEISPAPTSSKRAGHWIWSRGRRMTTSEAARIQGSLSDSFVLLPSGSQCCFSFLLAANAQGHRVPDPWTEGTRQQALFEEAGKDRLTPSQLQRVLDCKVQHSSDNGFFANGSHSIKNIFVPNGVGAEPCSSDVKHPDGAYGVKQAAKAPNDPGVPKY